MKNILKALNWDNYSISTNSQFFSKDLLSKSINQFWTEIVDKQLKSNQHILFMYRLQWSDKQIATIGNLQRLNLEDKNYIINFLLDEIINKGEYYLDTSIISIIISYGIRDGKAIEKSIVARTQSHNYQNHNLPISMNPLDYGRLLRRIDNEYWIQVNDKNSAIIVINENYNEIKFFRSGNLLYQWTDKRINPNTFSRTIGRKEFIFRDNELILYKQSKPVKFISRLNKNKDLIIKFITLDIETFLKDGIHIPYCICWYDGVNSFSYYLTDFKYMEDMVKACIRDITVKKYDNFKIYAHNLARFDAIFLLKILAELGYVKPTIHNGKIISINFKLGDYTVTFLDSQHMLIASLRNLAKSFKILIQKSVFPYKFVNEDNLNYIGNVPDFNYFDGLTFDEYKTYCDKFDFTLWSLRDETIKYCTIDCISLYQVLFKFNGLIFNLFKLNLYKFPTLSSLAFGIYRSNFLIPNTIPQISGQVEKDIRMSYTGGAVDMYIPKPPKGVKLYGYDVNALYPFVMDECFLPIGKPTLFEGDVRLIDPKAFGFFYCNIIAPTELQHPILQTHVKTNDGIRTIAPLGAWSDMIFSPEMDNAIKFGYKFEILWGYTFQNGSVFKDYVGTLYDLRTQYPKTDPMNYLAKILLNSLHGRLGMEDSYPIIQIMSIETYNKFEQEHNSNIIDITKLGGKVMVTYRSLERDVNTLLDNASEVHNVSIPVAAAISSYARIHMSQFKNNTDFVLYYSDTDSIYIDKKLPDTFVSSNVLGKMKLEHVIEKAIFLSPKAYILITEDGKVIYKVKGLNHNIELNYNDFYNLLYRDSFLQKMQTKWSKNISDGYISVLQQLYTLKVTDNKRQLIYKNDKLIGTKPFIIDSSKDLS